jgi:hypothetical protein
MRRKQNKGKASFALANSLHLRVSPTGLSACFALCTVYQGDG